MGRAGRGTKCGSNSFPGLIRLQVEHKEPLLLFHFSEGSPFHRAGVEDRGGKRVPLEIVDEALVAMDVPR